jgi:tetrathionate reductase subunit B
MAVKYAMVIDSSKCFNCQACVVSCQIVNEVPAESYRNWIKHALVDAGTAVHHQPGNCMQCDKPSCVPACPYAATYKDKEDGIVKVNTELCIGCGSCVPACPYGARFRHPERRVVDKCDYCVKRRAQGLPPACVEVCPTQARVFGDLLDTDRRAAQLLKQNKTVRVISQVTKTDPAIYYLSATAPMDWPGEGKPPEPILLWRQIGNPLVQVVVGLNALGVLVMLGKQLLLSDEPPEHAEEPGKEDADGPNNA